MTSYCCHHFTLFAVAEADEAKLMGEWFSLVREKNGLVRYESELMVRLVWDTGLRPHCTHTYAPILCVCICNINSFQNYHVIYVYVYIKQYGLLIWLVS